ncbi:MAG: xylose ABC transporter ATP-binding protein [Bacillota bacterium]|nr:MAG: xylose ABC transporter ATP-binding protein [Bacillota bacterium]
MYALEMRGITKEFPGVRALDNVTFQVRKGEIHALLGENGAGKSTLMKVLSGVYPAGTFTGEIIVDGRPRQFRSVKDAEEAGIAIIHQEFALVKSMTVGENIFLGREPTRSGVIDWDRVYTEASRWLAEVGLDNVNPRARIEDLGVGQQQLVEIAKALSKRMEILVLDEPTAALTESETETLLQLLQDLRSRGVTCIYISHKLEEVFRIADRITVLRDGRTVGTWDARELDEDRVIAHMVGRELSQRFPPRKSAPGPVVLAIRNFSVRAPDNPARLVVENVNLEVRAGEILGIAGLMGAGRTELVSSLFGGYGIAEGEIWFEGRKITIRNPRDAIRHGIGFVTEDRKRSGLVLKMDVKKNMTLARLDRVVRWGFLDTDEEIRQTGRYVEELRIRTPSLETPVSNLSGGNQQKVVLAKWLLAQPKVLILDEPTRGIDVGAKYEIYEIMNALAERGVAIIMISSELQEILGMSDRIVVMHEGRITGQFQREEATQELIMACATGRVRV